MTQRLRSLVPVPASRLHSNEKSSGQVRGALIPGDRHLHPHLARHGPLPIAAPLVALNDDPSDDPIRLVVVSP
jgi:hypothetical protein